MAGGPGDNRRGTNRGRTEAIVDSPTVAWLMLAAGLLAAALCLRAFLRKRLPGHLLMMSSFLVIAAAAAVSLAVEHALEVEVAPSTRVLVKLVVIAVAVPLYLVGSSSARSRK